MDMINDKWDKQTLEKMAQMGVSAMNGVTTIANLRGISNAELEALYSVGFANYGAGKYDDAEKVFHFLCTLCHTNAKYWLALGSVRHAKRNFDGAVKAYAAAAMWDIHRPKPHYYSAECNLALGNLDEAESGALSLLDMCPAGTVENNEFRAKAEKLLETIKATREAK